MTLVFPTNDESNYHHKLSGFKAIGLHPRNQCDIYYIYKL